MVDRTSVAPLIAIDAVVMDTETTGLDAANARMIEVGAVRLTGGRIADAPPLRRLVRPDIPIPAESTRIHGFNDAAVADAPRFPAVWPEVAGLFRRHGADRSFDRLRSRGAGARMRACEYSVAGPAEPLHAASVGDRQSGALADFSLDHVAGWLGVEVVGRHSALGDATTAAKIFQKLVPLLRNRGIRTLGEAIRATATLRRLIDEQIRAGWTDVTGVPADPFADDADRASIPIHTGIGCTRS